MARRWPDVRTAVPVIAAIREQLRRYVRRHGAAAVAGEVAFVAALTTAVLIAVRIAAANLDAMGIATGFDFLDEPAGFDLAFTLIPFDESASYGRAIVAGLVNTIAVCVAAIIAATVVGVAMGLACLSPVRALRALGTVWVETFRNVPLLLQLFAVYFGLLRPLPAPRDALALGDWVFLSNRGIAIPAFAPSWPSYLGFMAAALLLILAWRRRNLRLGLGAGVLTAAALTLGTWEVPVLGRFNFSGGWTLIPELVALWTGLVTYTSAYIAEVVRAGVTAVPRGQIEAARALGLSRSAQLRYIVYPQALRIVVPPLANQYLNLVKNSSLAVAIGFPDLFAVTAGTTLNQTGQAIETIAITMACYLAMSLGLAWWLGRRSGTAPITA